MDSRAARLTGTALLLVLVAAPRFDMRDPGPIGDLTRGATAFSYGHPLDVEGYVRLTRYFRGDAPADSMMSPYCFRPAVPLVASAIPAAPKTAINIVNVLCLVLTLLVLDATLGTLGLGVRARLIGGLLFAVSFPTFYYGTIGMIDSAAVLCVAVFSWMALRGTPLAAQCAFAAIAALVKETTAVFALAAFALAWCRRDRGPRSSLRYLAIPGIGVTAALLARWALPFPDPAYFWIPAGSMVAENLTRPRTYLSLFLTLGLPGLMAALALVRRRALPVLGAPQTSYLVTGSALGFVLYGYSVLSAYTDGRVIWTIYPFAIPLAVSWIEPKESARPYR